MLKTEPNTPHIGPDHKRGLTPLHFHIMEYHLKEKDGALNNSSAVKKYTRQLWNIGMLENDPIRGSLTLTAPGKELLLNMRYVVGRALSQLEV